MFCHVEVVLARKDLRWTFSKQLFAVSQLIFYKFFYKNIFIDNKKIFHVFLDISKIYFLFIDITYLFFLYKHDYKFSTAKRF